MFKAIGNFFKNFLTKEEVLPEQIDVIFESVDIDRVIKTLNIKGNGSDDGATGENGTQQKRVAARSACTTEKATTATATTTSWDAWRSLNIILL